MNKDKCQYSECFKISESYTVQTIKGFTIPMLLCYEHQELFKKEFNEVSITDYYLCRSCGESSELKNMKKVNIGGEIKLFQCAKCGDGLK